MNASMTLTASQEAAAPAIAASTDLLAKARSARSKAPEAIAIAITSVCRVAMIAAAEAECQEQPATADQLFRAVDQLYRGSRNTATLDARKAVLALASETFDAACAVLAQA